MSVDDFNKLAVGEYFYFPKPLKAIEIPSTPVIPNEKYQGNGKTSLSLTSSDANKVSNPAQYHEFKGEDPKMLDGWVRDMPARAFEVNFAERLRKNGASESVVQDAINNPVHRPEILVRHRIPKNGPSWGMGGMLVPSDSDNAATLQEELPHNWDGAGEHPAVQEFIPAAVSRTFDQLAASGSNMLRKFKGFFGGTHTDDIVASGTGNSPIDTFYDANNGFSLDQYVAIIQHIRDLPPAERDAYRNRYISALHDSPESIGKVMQDIASERMKQGFPFEPARLDTVLNRQTGSAEQAVVEIINNGFDAMGDAIGRFGVGVFQAVGWLENDGESLSYRGVSSQDPRRAYWVRFHRADGKLWAQMGSEALSKNYAPGTEVVLHKNEKIDEAKLKDYLSRKLALSRRGEIMEISETRNKTLNDLSQYRTVDGSPVDYRLSGGRVVRIELARGGTELRVMDSGRGLGPDTVAESLPVPGVSTNRTSAELAQELQRGDAKTSVESVFYKQSSDNVSRGKVAFLVGGTEVETLAVDGEALAPEVVVDLPAGAYQKEARTQIVLDEMTVASIKRSVDRTVADFQQNPERLAPVINSLASALSELQGSNRIKSLRKEDDLFLHLRDQIRANVSQLRQEYVVIPSIAKNASISPEALAGRKPILLDARLWDFDPASVGGEPVPGTGKSLWSVKMDRPFLKVGDRLVLFNADIVSLQQAKALHGQSPALLNLILGAWLGYGERPPPEATIAPEASPVRSGVSESPVIEKNSKIIHETDAILTSITGIDQRLKLFLALLVMDSLESGEAPSALSQKLRRVEQVCEMLPGLSPESIRSGLGSVFLRPYQKIKEIYPESGFFVADSGHFGEEDLSLYRATEHGWEVVPGLVDMYSIDIPTQVGDTTFIIAEQSFIDKTQHAHWHKNLYRIRDGKVQMAEQMKNMQRIDRPAKSPDGSFYIHAVDARGFSSIYTIRDGEMTPIQGLEEIFLLNQYDPRDTGSRWFVVGQNKNGEKTAFEIKGGRARPIKNLENLKEGVSIRAAGERLFTNVTVEGGSSLYEIVDDRAVPIRGLERIPRSREMGVRFANGRYLVNLHSPSEQYEIKGMTAELLRDSDQNNPRLYQAGRIGSWEFFYAYGPDGFSKYFHSQNGRLQALVGLENVGYIDRTVPLGNELLAAGRSKIERGEDRFSVREGVYRIREGHAEPIPGLQEKKSVGQFITTGNHVFVEATNLDGTHSVFQIGEKGAAQVLHMPARDSLMPEAATVDGISFIKTYDYENSLYRLFVIEHDKAHEILAEKYIETPQLIGRRILFVDTRQEDRSKSIYEFSKTSKQAVPVLTGLRDVHMLSGKNTEGTVLYKRGFEDNWSDISVGPLSKIGTSPLAEKIEIPSGLTTAERSRLASNLLQLRWSSEKLQRLGWALPFIESRTLDRLEEANQTALSTDLNGLLENRKREAFTFLAGAQKEIAQDATFNNVVFRWLKIFKADPARALELARALDGHYDQLNGTSSDSTSPLIAFLRGQTNLEPLAVEEPDAVKQKTVGRSVTNVPLSSLAGARANLRIVKKGGHQLKISDLAGKLPTEGYAQTEDAMLRAQGAEAGYEWLREGVQNAVKASEQAGVSPVVDVRTGMRRNGGKTELVASIRDHGSGMDVYEILHDLLPLDRSSFSQGQDPSLGFNGRGWYKFLVRSDRVRVTSGKPGSSSHVELEAYKERRPDGRSAWRVANLRELKGGFSGTEVEWIQEKTGSIEANRFGMELEAALIGDSLQTYAGALGERGVAINYNGRTAVEQIGERSAVSWNGDEKVRVVETSSKKRRILQNGFFVMDMEQDPDMWKLVPDELMEFMRKQGLSIDLPASKQAHRFSVVLDRDRSGLAEKSRYLDRLQKAVLTAVSEAAALSMAEGRWRPRGLPVDYVYRSAHLWANKTDLHRETQALAQNLSEGKWEKVNPKSVNEVLGTDPDGSRLAHFIASVEFPWEGRVLSLAQLREETQAQARRNASQQQRQQNLPSAFAAMVREATGKYEDLLTGSAEDDVWHFENPSGLTAEDRHAKELLSSLISGLMKPVAEKRAGSRSEVESVVSIFTKTVNTKHFYNAGEPYQVSFGHTKYPRLANFGKDWISLNADAGQVKGWLDWISRAQRRHTSPEEDYRNLFNILENVVHEDAHAWEPGTEETHNEAFLERMRSTLIDLAALRMSPESVLKERLVDASTPANTVDIDEPKAVSAAAGAH